MRYELLSTFMKATYLTVAGSAMPNRMTAASATKSASTRRPSGPNTLEMRSKRISSLSLSQNAEPSSTMYNHAITDSSEDQPIGKLKK